MSLIRRYYHRFQVLIHEVAKFLLVGGLGTIIQLGCQNALHLGLGVGPSVAVVGGYAVATVVTFLGNRYWAFKNRKGKGFGRESGLFIVLNVIGILIQVGMVDIAYYGLDMRDGLSYNVASCIGIVLGTIFRLFTYRKFVFLAPAAPAETETLEPADSLG